LNLDKFPQKYPLSHKFIEKTGASLDQALEFLKKLEDERDEGKRSFTIPE
jgi:hypothetical protein